MNVVIPNTTVSAIAVETIDGTLYNAFAANRTDLAGTIITVNYNNYKDILGEPSPKNKLGTFFDLMSKEVVGFEMQAYVTKDDKDESYIEAINMLATSPKVYEISVLTDSLSVFGALQSAVEKAADPLISTFKMGIFAGRLPFYSVKIKITDGVVTNNNDGTYTIESTTGGFSNVNLTEGDYIIGDKDLAIADEEYYNTVGEPYSSKVVAKVVSVLTDKKIIVVPTNPDIALDEVLAGQVPTVIKLNSKQEMIEIIASRAKAANNKNIVYVMPDKYIANGKLYPGYYVAALIAGILAHLPPQQGLSNMSFKTIDKVINSSFFFTDNELDAIASAGVLVIAQISNDTKPYIIRQLTTNMNSLEEMEINKVRCLDYAALEVKKSVDNYTGKRNVTERNRIDVEETIRATLSGIQKETDNDLLGAVVTDFKINYVAIPDGEPDTIEGDIEVWTPTSLNGIRLFVKSKS